MSEKPYKGTKKTIIITTFARSFTRRLISYRILIVLIKKMLSKNKIKYLHSLKSKKFRDAEGVFVAEGPKVVGDIFAYYPSNLILLIATSEWLHREGKTLSTATNCEIIEVTEEELTKASFLCHPQQVLGVFKKQNNCVDINMLTTKLTLVLDGVQDPGNLGTIIRIADWFGIENVVCSGDTADVYNPKVVQATMGSIARVNVVYMNLPELFDSLPTNIPIYGTLLEGDNIYEQALSDVGLIVMGNEGKGISPTIRKYVNCALRIPNFPKGRDTADSLNVAIATSIVCAEFRRRF